MELKFYCRLGKKTTSLRLDYDTHYGILNRCGWSVHINGICYVQFWPGPIEAILWAIMLHLYYGWDMRQGERKRTAMKKDA